MENSSRLYTIYNKLYQIGKEINESVNVEDLYSIACDFTTNELNFQKSIIFEHDDRNGWFKVVKSSGYDNPMEQKILSIVNLLLSGEVIEYLRVNGEPIIHTKESPKEQVSSLLKSLFLEEAYLELIGGDKNIPYGLIIAGNGKDLENKYSKLLDDSFLMMALGNFTVQLSNTINNIVFYKAWQDEKEKLEENIELRTKELNEQKRTFEAIYKTSKDGIAILDLETTAFLDVNDAYCDMTNFTREELLRTSCLKLSLEEDKEKSMKALEEIQQKGYITNFIKRCKTKNDAIIIVNMSISLMDDKKRMLVSSKDITKQKELEQALQQMNNELELRIQEEVEKNRRQEFQLLEQSKNASMGEMIGNIAHQWRQPLSAITSTASALKLSDQLSIIEENEIVEKMDSVIEKARYLSETIDTFRNFLKENNNAFGEFNLEDTLTKSLNIVGTAMKDSHIKLITDEIDQMNKTPFVGNESELSQVIINILNNAKDILKEKKVKEPWVKIVLNKCEEESCFTIEDNGGGIPDDVMPRIFDPYFTTKHQSQGTGLGLHMSYRIVTESFKGKLSVENTKNGAKFFISLPSMKK
jgi:PAS domain S-box-containing protein